MLHNVYFWLKKDLTADQLATFEAELLKVTQIPYLANGAYGKPAPTEERPVTDHSFSYSLHLQFKTMADHDHYQKGCEHHERFVKICKPFFDKVIVYDTAPVK
jgi:hypothetical protein